MNSTRNGTADEATPPAGGMSTVRSPARRSVGQVWARRRPQERIAVLIAVLIAVAAGLFSSVVGYPAPGDVPMQMPWLLWVAAFAAGECIVVHVQLRRDSHSFSMTDLVLAAALCLAPPGVVVTAQLAGSGLVLLADRRQSATKRVFNLAQFALSDCLAVTVFVLLTHGRDWSSPWIWAGALAAVTVSIVTAAVCVFAAIALSEGGVGIGDLRRMLALPVPFAVGIAAVGLLVVRTAALDPLALVLIAPPAALLIAAYRAYTDARRQEDGLRLLHEITSLLHESGSARDGLANFVTAVRKAFRAGVAELVLLGGADDGATVTRSREGQEAVALLPLADDDDTARLLKTASADGDTTTRSGARPAGPLDDYVARRGLKGAVLSVLRTEDRVHGLLLVGGRLGDVTRFDDSDVALLGTFAGHVATSLERGRLQSDLTHITELQEKLRHQAMHDALTGLPNRTLFLDRAENALRLAGRTGVWPAVLYLDLDGFKPVNDTYGHEAGDVLLQAFAQRLRGCLRSADTAARLGGDEFAVLVNGPVDADGIDRVVDRIRTQMVLPIELGAGRDATVGASIGAAIAGPATADVETLVRHADAAMYTAKRARNGRHVLHQEAGPGHVLDVAGA